MKNRVAFYVVSTLCCLSCFLFSACSKRANDSSVCYKDCEKSKFYKAENLIDNSDGSSKSSESLIKSSTSFTKTVNKNLSNANTVSAKKPLGTSKNKTVNQSNHDVEPNENPYTVVLNDKINQNNVSEYRVSGTCFPNSSFIEIDYKKKIEPLTCNNGLWQSVLDMSDIMDDNAIPINFFFMDKNKKITQKITRIVSKDTIAPQLLDLSAPDFFKYSNQLSIISGACSEVGRVQLSAFGISYDIDCDHSPWQQAIKVPDYQGRQVDIDMTVYDLYQNARSYRIEVPFCSPNPIQSEATEAVSTALSVYDDKSFVSFEQNRLPTDWTTLKGTLSISQVHFKHGKRSLRWDWRCGDQLVVENIQSMGLVANEVTNFYFHNFRLWIYNLKALPNRKMLITFWNDDQPEYFYDINLNFTGWRPAMVSYKYDMKGTKRTGNINKMTINMPSSDVGTIFLDFIDFTTDRLTGASSDEQRIINWGSKNSAYYYNQYEKFYAEEVVTALEQVDIDVIHSRYWPKVKKNKPSNTAIEAALNTVNQLAITESHGYIQGAPLFTTAYHHPGIDYSKALSTLTTLIPAYRATKNALYLENSILVLKHVLDQGLAWGSNFESTHVIGYLLDDFINEILLIKSELKAAGIWESVFSMLQWHGVINQLWSTTSVSNMDYANTQLFEIVGMLLSFDSPIKQKQYLRAFTYAVEQWLTVKPMAGGSGLKPDFSTFHHGTHYPGYSYPALSAIAMIIDLLQGTSFAISAEKQAVFEQLLKSSVINHVNVHIPLSLAGRKPFGQYNFTSPLALIAKHSDSTSWLAISDYLYKNGDLSALPLVQQQLWGFWQFNYRPMAVYRQANWMINIKGFNTDFWGSEIYSDANRYGRFQSYGSVFVHYQDKGHSGYAKSGWDWRFIPGATTQRLDYDDLLAKKARQDERTDSQFSGALRFNLKSEPFISNELEGTMGLYGFDFQQKAISSSHDSHFGFKKSYFAIDGKLLCLGSNIRSQSNTTDIVTTLLQSQVSNSPSLWVNGESVTNDTDESGRQGIYSLIDAYKTGYIIKDDDQSIGLFYGEQSAPNHGNTSEQSGQFMRAWINHGRKPQAGRYHYWVIPDTTPQQLTTQVSLLNDTYYQVAQQDSTAHIVQFLHDNLTAYVIYKADTTINNQMIISTSHPIMAMTKLQGDQLQLTMVKPNIQFESGQAVVSEVTVLLDGSWQEQTNKAVTTVDHQKSTIKFDTQNGAPIDLVFKRI